MRLLAFGLRSCGPSKLHVMSSVLLPATLTNHLPLMCDFMRQIYCLHCVYLIQRRPRCFVNTAHTLVHAKQRIWIPELANAAHMREAGIVAGIKHRSLDRSYYRRLLGFASPLTMFELSWCLRVCRLEVLRHVQVTELSPAHNRPTWGLIATHRKQRTDERSATSVLTGWRFPLWYPPPSV